MTTWTGQPEALTALERSRRRRRDLRLVTLGWVFGAVWMAVVMGPVMQEFLRSVGTPAWAFGLVGAIPVVCGLSQLPAGLLVDRFGRRKTLFLVATTAGRALCIVIGLIPWLMPGLDEMWWRLALGTLVVSWLLGQASGPAWTQWMSQVIPRRVRGRYFAYRSQVGHVLMVATALITGGLMDHFGGQPGDGDTSLRLIASVLLIVAGVMGVLDIQCFHPIAEHPAHNDPAHRLRPRIVQALRNRKLWLFIAYAFVIQLAFGGIAGYMFLYLREHIGLSMTAMNFALALMPLPVMLWGMRFWGRMADRLGPEKVVAATTLLAVFGPVGYLLATPEVFWGPFVLMLIGPLAWSGLAQAMFQMTMDLSTPPHPHPQNRPRNFPSRGVSASEGRGGGVPGGVSGGVSGGGGAHPVDLCAGEAVGDTRQTSRDAGETPGSVAKHFGRAEGIPRGVEKTSGGAGSAVNVALVSVAGAGGAVLSGLWMGAVAQAAGGVHVQPGGLGIHLTYHGVIFLVSMAIRMVAVVLAMLMVARVGLRVRDVVRQQIRTRPHPRES